MSGKTDMIMKTLWRHIFGQWSSH